MDFLRQADEIDSVVPGVTEVYRQLRSSGGAGIYTSMGRYYNHTIFGRDSGMTAKFVSDFNHETVWETIMTLASRQGVEYDPITQQAPGRIHHEYRDMAAWRGRWYDRVGLVVAGKLWGAQNREFCTYYAADTTATYVRLIHKYATAIDASIMQRQVPTLDRQTASVSESVLAAVRWMVAQVDDDGIFRVRRTNRWSLPYQTFADSVTAYAWNSGAAMDTSHDHAYVETQAYVIDALQDACRILPHELQDREWKSIIQRMHTALFERFWSEDRKTFAPALSSRGHELEQLDTDMISAGWTLNASFWDVLPDAQHTARITALVERLFRDDFLTDYGMRTKSTTVNEPLGRAIDYHGSQTVWPMFNFMVIEGLRRHGLRRLARQLENRTINTINAIGDFAEFFIVDHDGQLYRPDKTARSRRSGQMVPEQNIAFSVVPALTLAYRHLYRRSPVAKSGWKKELEDQILSRIPPVDLLSPENARKAVAATPIRIARTWAGIRSAAHVAPVILRKP